MTEKVKRFFMRNHIRPDTIKYIIREDRKTVVYLQDERTPSTNMPLKDIFAALPGGKFLNVHKGVILAARQIQSISDEGVYTMLDGRTFQGRKRSLREHQDTRQMLFLDTETPMHSTAAMLAEKCTIFDNSPVALCLIELLTDSTGSIIDFVFRYCNAQMENLEGVPVEQMIGHTIRETFPGANYSKLIAYADVALHGTNRIAESYNFVNNEPQKVYCYQPEKGFCICFVAKDNE